MGPENPYVGARPLTRKQGLFGRDHERRELVELVIAERIVLLHAASGAGKTSLIQGRGGVADMLRDEGFIILPSARVGLAPSTPRSENRYVDSLLSSIEHETSDSVTLEAALSNVVAQHVEPVGVVLVVDPFEEILTVDPTGERERIAFFEALGHALEERRLWALFALRNEYLGALAPYRPRIPTHLRATFHLDLLGTDAAREAIMRPAREAGVPFTCEAADKLVQELSIVTVPRPDGTTERKPGTSVEPLQLQVVCHRLWLRRDLGAKEISAQEVSGVGSVNVALSEYYAAAVDEAARVSGESERAIRDWTERELITRSGVRSQVMRYGGGERRLRDEAVRHLVDAYVLRQDTRRGIDWLELAHDRLIAPVRLNNAAWRDKHLNVTQKRAVLWDERGRDTALCLRGRALADAARWASAHKGELTAVEERFLAESRRVQNEERAGRLRGWLAILGVMSALLVMAAALAAIKEKVAVQAQRAERRALVMAHARELVGHDQPAVAMKLLLEVDHAEDEPGWIDVANEALNAGGLLVTLRAKSGYQPFLVGFSPDGAKVFATDGDQHVKTGNKVYVLNANGRGDPVVLSGCQGPIMTAAFTLDGKGVATVCEDGFVSVSNADGTGEPLVKRIDPGFDFATLSRDASRLTTTFPDGTVKIWNIGNHSRPVILHGPKLIPVQPFGFPAFSSDGTNIAAASGDGTVTVWNTDGSRKSVVLTGHAGKVTCLALSPDGTRGVTGGEDKTVRLWSVDDANAHRVLGTHDDKVLLVSFSPDGTKIVSASEDKTARVWSTDGSSAPVLLAGHEARVSAAAFNATGTQIVTASFDGTARVWNADGFGTPKILSGHEGDVILAAYSPDGTKIVTTTLVDGTIRMWNANGSGESVADIHGPVSGSNAFSPDLKRMLYVPWYGGTTEMLSVERSQKPVYLKGDNFMSAFSPDGTKIVVSSLDGKVRVWNADGSGEPVVFRSHKASVYYAAFSPDGKRIVMASGDHIAQVWNADGSGEPVVFRGHEASIYYAAFSPDGKRIVTASGDHTAQVWNADGSGEPVVFRGHEASVFCAAFSPDGKGIVTGSADKTARVWSVNRPEAPVSVLRGHRGAIMAVAFSPDGESIVTGAADWTARVWHSASADKPIVLRGHTSPVLSLAFGPNRRIITADAYGSVKVWNLSFEALRTQLQSANADCLSPTERNRYLEEEPSVAKANYGRCERDHDRTPSD